MTGMVMLSLSTIFCETKSLWDYTGIQALMIIDHGNHRLLHKILESWCRNLLRFGNDRFMTIVSHNGSELHKPTDLKVL